MALSKAELEFYPEEYLLEEDDMGESNPQFRLIKLLADILEWYYRTAGWLIAGNLELYHPAIRNSQSKVTPDIAVFKDIIVSEQERLSLTSWDIGPDRPTPPVVFEISSRSTWRSDIWSGELRKPAIYGRIGVREYFAYDPHQPPIWSGTNGRRLLGWRYTSDGIPLELAPDEQGRLWSEVLESWLVADGPNLRLADQAGQLRPTSTEVSTYERLAREAAEQLIQTEQTARKAAERRIIELERELDELKGQS